MPGTLAGVTTSRTLHFGNLGHRIAFDPGAGLITRRKRTYPVAGARAEVSDFQSGTFGRKHTVDLTVTLATGEVLTWHETGTGMTARLLHNTAMSFAAAVNTAASR